MGAVAAQPLIAVSDVEASSRWYCALLGCTSGHGGPEYERIMDGDEFVLQLHDWNVHEHRYLGDEASRPWGNGSVLWFRVRDFDAAVVRAGELGARILEGPHDNQRARQRELWLQDPDGYVVVLASRSEWDASSSDSP
jgi:catechol 2,3-dioxygenase-like lactoylglutathione lyase family enzyme